MLPSPDRTRPQFIKTKFAVPQPRAGLVLRPRLRSLLADGVTRPLTLICAPAGYGKTTLLAEWAAALATGEDGAKPRICWLSLDANDDDPAIFLRYLIAALDRDRAATGSPSLTALSASPIPPIQTVMGLLINDLVDQTDSILLVLDDYQFITQPVLQEGLSFFIDHLPASVHCVLLTRSDPPFPIARLRARGQLVEIRAEDLRFTLEETSSFLNQTMALGLSPAHVAQLDERTEGWAAGLQMAALALASHPDAAAFVSSFSGSHRYILDYLIEEVLSRQPAEVQSFLLQTSVLENLCAPLCDAVTGLPARPGQPASQQILESLERANLFLIPLDSDRVWFRYHHLFADLLRARLEQQDPALARALHRRASGWFENSQRSTEAIHHALSGAAFDHACTLIEAQVPYRVTHNGMGLLMGWIRRLPAEMANSRPWLCVAQAWSLLFTNEMNRCEPLLLSAGSHILAGAPAEEQNQLRGHLACLWAVLYALDYDESQRTIAMANQALDFLPESDAVTRTFANYLLGRTYFLYGDFPLALSILTKNARDCMQAAATNYLAHTLSLISRICRIEGRLADALALVREGCAYIEAHDPRRVTVAGTAFIGQVDILREWNQLEEADALARWALALLLPWENPGSTCSLYTWMIRIDLARGRFDSAKATLDAAHAALHERKPMAGVRSDLHQAQVMYWLSTGQQTEAVQWARAQEREIAAANDYPICREQEEMTLARVWIAEGRCQPALRRLESLAEAAERAGRFGRLIEIHILRALAHQAQSQPGPALRALEDALRLAEPEGYLRIFLDEGEPVRELLSRYRQSAEPRYRAYAQKISAAAVIHAATAASVVAPPGPAGSWQYPVHPDDVLTAREIEVLRGMVEGFSNRQIAQNLILAEGTIKFYIHALYEKLGAHNRTQALIEARKRNLI